MRERVKIKAIRPFLVNGIMVPVDGRPFEMAEPWASEAIARGDAEADVPKKFASCAEPVGGEPETPAAPKNAEKPKEKEKKG